MAGKKRGKNKSRYAALPSKSKIAGNETYKQMRAKFPKELVSTYLKTVKNGFKDELLYNKFVEARAKYLGDKAEDRLECGKVIVYLSRATVDLIKRTNVKEKTQEEKEAEES